MAEFDGVFAILTGGGIGAGIATIATAVIQSRSGKSESRAHAADMLAEASGKLSGHYVKEITRLTESVGAMRIAIANLTTVIDELLEQSDFAPEQVVRIQKVSAAAKAVT